MPANVHLAREVDLTGLRGLIVRAGCAGKVQPARRILRQTLDGDVTARNGVEVVQEGITNIPGQVAGFNNVPLSSRHVGSRRCIGCRRLSRCGLSGFRAL